MAVSCQRHCRGTDHSLSMYCKIYESIRYASAPVWHRDISWHWYELYLEYFL